LLQFASLRANLTGQQLADIQYDPPPFTPTKPTKNKKTARPQVSPRYSLRSNSKPGGTTGQKKKAEAQGSVPRNSTRKRKHDPSDAEEFEQMWEDETWDLTVLVCK
jgi:hypothetical protein